MYFGGSFQCSRLEMTGTQVQEKSYAGASKYFWRRRNELLSLIIQYFTSLYDRKYECILIIKSSFHQLSRCERETQAMPCVSSSSLPSPREISCIFNRI